MTSFRSRELLPAMRAASKEAMGWRGDGGGWGWWTVFDEVRLMENGEMMETSVSAWMRRGHENRPRRNIRLVRREEVEERKMVIKEGVDDDEGRYRVSLGSWMTLSVGPVDLRVTLLKVD